MPFTRETLEGLLPDPGFSKHEGLIGKESSSFAGRYDTSLSFTTVAGMLSGYYRKQTDDLTFIIPFAASDNARVEAFHATISWIIATTSAKIIVCSAENEDTYKTFSNPKAFIGDTFLTWEEYKDPEVSDLRKMSYMLAEMHLAMCDKFCVAYALREHFGVNILEEENLRKEFVNRVSVIVEPREKGEPFHRTRYLNMMLDKVQTPFVCNHDADTLLTSNGIMTSLTYLRKNAAHVVYPYQRGIRAQKRVFFKAMTAPNPLNSLILTGDISDLLHSEYGILEWSASYGQSIFFNSDVYKQMGGENENFISWGSEDLERYTRAVKLGLVVARVPAPIVHIEHGRGADSSQENPKYQENEVLSKSLSEMDGQQLKDYYDNAEYRKAYKW